MARLTPENAGRARDLMALYPEPRSALIPILHLAQEQDGYLTAEAMGHIGELIGLTAAEVRGTASFYDMLHLHPVGKYVLSICTNIACLLNGGYELLEHAEKSLGVKAGVTTPDGMFTVEEFECLALCGNAPCLTANWRFFGDLTPDKFDTLIDDLRTGRLDADVPPHGTLCRVRRAVGLVAQGPAKGQAPKTQAPAAPAPAESTAPPAAAAPVPTPSPAQEGASPVPEQSAPPVSQPHGSQAPAGDADQVQPSGAPTTPGASGAPTTPGASGAPTTPGASGSPTTEAPAGAETPAETATAAEPATTPDPEPARPPTDIANRNEKPEESGS